MLYLLQLLAHTASCCWQVAYEVCLNKMMVGGAFGYGNADARPYRKSVERKKPDNSVNLGGLRKSLQKKKQIRAQLLPEYQVVHLVLLR